MKINIGNILVEYYWINGICNGIILILQFLLLFEMGGHTV